MFLSCLSIVRRLERPWIMLAEAVRLGPLRPRPRPVGGLGGASFGFAKVWLASFQLVVRVTIGDVPLSYEFAVRIHNFVHAFVGPEVEFQGNWTFRR
jgi:hypothetical protein